MAKRVLRRIGKFWKMGVVVLLIIFGVLLILGYYLGPDKMMRPPPGQAAEETQP